MPARFFHSGDSTQEIVKRVAQGLKVSRILIVGLTSHLSGSGYFWLFDVRRKGDGVRGALSRGGDAGFDCFLDQVGFIDDPLLVDFGLATQGAVCELVGDDDARHVGGHG